MFSDAFSIENGLKDFVFSLEAYFCKVIPLYIIDLRKRPFWFNSDNRRVNFWRGVKALFTDFHKMLHFRHKSQIDGKAAIIFCSWLGDHAHGKFLLEHNNSTSELRSMKE